MSLLDSFAGVFDSIGRLVVEAPGPARPRTPASPDPGRDAAPALHFFVPELAASPGAVESAGFESPTPPGLVEIFFPKSQPAKTASPPPECPKSADSLFSQTATAVPSPIASLADSMSPSSPLTRPSDGSGEADRRWEDSPSPIASPAFDWEHIEESPDSAAQPPLQDADDQAVIGELGVIQRKMERLCKRLQAVETVLADQRVKRTATQIARLKAMYEEISQEAAKIRDQWQRAVVPCSSKQSSAIPRAVAVPATPRDKKTYAPGAVRPGPEVPKPAATMRALASGPLGAAPGSTRLVCII